MRTRSIWNTATSLGTRKESWNKNFPIPYDVSDARDKFITRASFTATL